MQDHNSFMEVMDMAKAGKCFYCGANRIVKDNICKRCRMLGIAETAVAAA